MPIYEYKCGKCALAFEEWQSGFEERELPCPECGAVSKRIISNTSFVLKGTGWAATGYVGESQSSGSGSAASGQAASSGGGSGDTGSSTSDAASKDSSTTTASAAGSAS